MANTSSSRLILIIGVLALALFAAQYAPRLIPTKFEFEDVTTLSGYRMLASGEISQSADPFVGLDDGDSPIPEHTRTWVAENICSALMQSPVNDTPADAVPVAYFTDVQCPYCRVLSGTLSELVHRTDPPILLSLREYPVFGKISEAAAAASLAAGMQGAHLEFHERLMSSPIRPSKAAIEAIVDELGLDEGKYWQDYRSPQLLEELSIHRAVGELFGIYGTPALVVGRTLVIGNIAPNDLERLIEIEREDARMNPCNGSSRG